MKNQSAPVWTTLLIVLCALPVVAFPTLLSLCGQESPLRLFVWFYPAYVAATAVCAWMCRKSRREMYWILLAVMLLTHAALWMGVLTE